MVGRLVGRLFPPKKLIQMLCVGGPKRFRPSSSSDFRDVSLYYYAPAAYDTTGDQESIPVTDDTLYPLEVTSNRNPLHSTVKSSRGKKQDVLKCNGRHTTSIFIILPLLLPLMGYYHN